MECAIICPMNEKFFDLKKEKQDRIINGALKIFGIYDYQHASTDDMVREAGISKGLLFHYFGSKIGVYAFVYEFVIRFWKMELAASIHEEEDPFLIFERRENARIQIMKRYPYLHLFLEKCQEEQCEEAVKRIEAYKDDYYMAGLIPYTYSTKKNMPADCSEEKLFAIIELTIQGLLRMYDRELIMGRTPDLDELNREIVTYLKAIKALV